MTRAVRGAIQVAADSRQSVHDAAVRLVAALLEANGLAESDLVSLLFSMTIDLTAGNPATGLRGAGFTEVPLFCVQEAAVEGGMPRVIRVLASFEVPGSWGTSGRVKATPVYLEGAATLRPDLDPQGPA